MNLQHDASHFGITGQDVARILGVSRFGPPLEVWAEKTGRIAPHAPSAAPELDAAILTWYLRTEGCTEQAYAPATREDHLIAAPDTMVVNEHRDVWNVNIVRVAWDAAELWGDPQNCDEVALPADEFWRGAHENYVLGVDRTDFVVMVAGAWPPKVYHVVNTAERYAEILPALLAFWGLVERGTEPPADFVHPAILDVVRRMHSSVNRRAVAELSAEHGALIVALEGLRGLRAQVDLTMKVLRAKLLHAVGDAWKGVDASTGATVVRRTVRGAGDREPYARVTTSVPEGAEMPSSAELLQLVEGIAAKSTRAETRLKLRPQTQTPRWPRR